MNNIHRNNTNNLKSNNVPAYAKVSLEKLRCNNFGQQQQPFQSNIYPPFQLQQPAWIYSHHDEHQPYPILGHPQPLTKTKAVANAANVSNSYRIQPSLPSKCFHHPSTPQYQPPHLRRPIRLTSDSCEHLASDDPWTPKPQFCNESVYSRTVYPSFQGGSSEQLTERLMPPPQNFDNSPSPVGEAVTRFDSEFSADSDQETSDQQLMSTRDEYSKTISA